MARTLGEQFIVKSDHSYSSSCSPKDYCCNKRATFCHFVATLMMTSFKVIKISVATTNNSPSKDYPYLYSQTTQR